MPAPQTSKPEYAPFLLASLSMGEAPRDAVLTRAHELMKGRLLPADFDLLHGTTPRWVNQADNMLDGLIEDGYVEEAGSRLRLTERGWAYLGGRRGSA